MADNLDPGADDAHLDAPLDDDARELIEAATGPEDAPIGLVERELARDEGGRFAPGRDPAPKAAETGGGEKPIDAAPVTVKELQELLDARERANRAERETADLRGRLSQYERPAAPKPKPLDDPHLVFQDPTAFRDALLAEARESIATTTQRLQSEAIEADLSRTASQTPEFKEAWDRFAAAANADPQLKAQFDALPTYGRGEKVLEWDRRNRALAAIPDGDLTKYEASLQEKLLNDPDFLAKAVAKATGGQGGRLPPPGMPRGNVTRLPSVSRAGSAATAALPAEESDEDLLHSITGGR